MLSLPLGPYFPCLSSRGGPGTQYRTPEGKELYAPAVRTGESSGCLWVQAQTGAYPGVFVLRAGFV